jgi:hypothetical protein
MFFFSLLSLSLQSFAPLKAPERVKNGRLKYAALIMKHGHISPLSFYTDTSKNGIWLCDSDESESPRMHSSYENGLRRRYQRTMIPRFMMYPPNCESGDLTTKGQSKIKELGEFFRDYLIYNNSLLPQDLDTSLFTVRTNHYDRCIRTAVSFMNGFYPPEVPDVEQVLIYSYGSSPSDVLNSGTKTCQEAIDKSAEFKASDLYKSRQAESLSILSNMKKQTSISTSSLVPKFGDWVMSFIDNGGLPITASETEIARTQEDTAFNLFQFAKFSNFVGSSPILRLLFKDIETSLAKGKKFNYYVLDSEQMATLAALVGDPEEKSIDFGAHLLLEIWYVPGSESENVIRFVYNGRPLMINGFNAEIAPLNKYKMYLSNNGFLSQCLSNFPY